ncbi:unnamed protein product [Brachionus calyciflorus]|uniref:Transmembrane protein n=1 Tax=Brachionus calyciflorus TaxID=104777 RepID=A0A813RRF0_9BILA|nr:unnamed protein product [Brachionus calyciflorus]
MFFVLLFNLCVVILAQNNYLNQKDAFKEFSPEKSLECKFNSSKKILVNLNTSISRVYVTNIHQNPERIIYEMDNQIISFVSLLGNSKIYYLKYFQVFTGLNSIPMGMDFMYKSIENDWIVTRFLFSFQKLRNSNMDNILKLLKNITIQEELEFDSFFHDKFEYEYFKCKNQKYLIYINQILISRSQFLEFTQAKQRLVRSVLITINETEFNSTNRTILKFSPDDEYIKFSILMTVILSVIFTSIFFVYIICNKDLVVKILEFLTNALDKFSSF